AIDAASDGDTIVVHDGVYTEQLIINKPLTLMAGSSPLLDFSGFSGSTKHIVDIQGAHDEVAGIYVNASDVTIDGFHFIGIAPDNMSNQLDSGLNTVIRAYTTADNLTVQNCVFDPPTGSVGRVAITVKWADNLRFLNNEINDYIYGVNLVDAGDSIDNALVQGNTFTQTQYVPGYASGMWFDFCEGVQLWLGDNLQVINNTFTGPGTSTGTGNLPSMVAVLDFNNYFDSGGTKTIKVENNTIENYYDGVDTCSNGIIEGNTISNNAIGVYVEDVSGIAPTINYNNIEGNSQYGVINDHTAVTLDATYNYWGHPSGPYHSTNPTGQGDNVSDNVDFIPWLDDEYPDSDYGYNQTSGVKDAYYEDVAAGTETTVDGTADTDATVTLNSTTPVGVTILLYEENPEGTNQGAYAIGKYLDVSVNDTSGVQWPINITLYYTQDDLDAAGLTEDDLIGIMFWNSSAMQWQYYNNTGVNKDYFDGTYIGYVWANVWHLTPVGLGGNDTTPPTTTKVVGQPKYGALPPYNQYVTTHTPIWLNASDGANESGLNATYYRIWYNNVWHPANSTDYYGGNHNITLIGSTYWYVYYKNGSISFGPIYFTEECHHKLQFYSIDNAGNNENVTTQDHYVDDTPPQSYLIVQDPKWPQNQGATFVTTSTVITLGANDIYGSCNVGSFYMHWRIWNGTWTPWHVGSRGEVINITFNEECKHYIEYYSEDNLGNVETTIHNRTFYVDESPPTSSIELGNPSYGNCITSQTPIWINATDPNAPCNSDNNSIYYHIWNSTSGWTTWMHTVHANLMTYIKDECKHYIEYYAVDALGNTESTIHNITLYVDDSTPVIVKTVGNPNVTVAPGEYYVTTSTPIIINATDVGCCPGMTVEYKVDSGAWNDITSSLPFTYQFTTEGLHTLYIRAYDNLGNIAYDNETFHVDNSPPAINKTVGNPNCNISSTEYCVTTSTLITINASDEAGLKNVSYRIWYSGTWTSWQNITSLLPYTFTFTEECEHYLEIYVEDDLGNDQVDNETFYVDDTTPVINKTVGDPNITGSGTPDYWVTTSTPITIDASDAGCCANMTVQYRIWNSTADTGWITISVPYTLYFTEECEHNLSIRAYDCLGHITYENETFYVDDSGPVVTKEVGQPQYGNFVTQHTPIWVNATDTGCNGGVGIERIRVYLWVDTDNDNTWDVAYSPFPSGMVYDNDANDLDSTVGRISVRVYFGEDTHHLIEWNSWDYLGNSGGYHSQAHYVDTVPPDSAVVFGSPSCNISSTEYCVTTSTPIWINATDNGTESWCTVGSYTIHWVIWNSTGIYDQGTSDNINATIYVSQECNHTLGYWVEDDLGNRWPSVGYY
ncbi:MAG: hypothetical protein J7J36_02735, partial [Thermoplasmata archaeon]|nr:hypothetical protein [Thermoplasmata archaeon]